MRQQGLWYYKLPDVVGGAFTPQKPCDYILLHEGRTWFIEVKVIRGKSRFNIRHSLRDNQHDSLMTAHENGQEAWLWCFYGCGNLRAYRISELPQGVIIPSEEGYGGMEFGYCTHVMPRTPDGRKKTETLFNIRAWLDQVTGKEVENEPL
jgi:hypothetical protein